VLLECLVNRITTRIIRAILSAINKNNIISVINQSVDNPLDKGNIYLFLIFVVYRGFM